MSCILELEGCLFAWRFWDILCVDGPERTAFLLSIGDSPVGWDSNSLLFVDQMRRGRAWSGHPDQSTSSIWSGEIPSTIMGFRPASCHALLRQFFNGDMDHRRDTMYTFLHGLHRPARVLVAVDRLEDTWDILRGLRLADVVTPVVVCTYERDTLRVGQRKSSMAIIPPMRSGCVGGLRGVHLRIITLGLENVYVPVPSPVDLVVPELSVLTALWFLVLRVPQWPVLPVHREQPNCDLSRTLDATTWACVGVVGRYTHHLLLDRQRNHLEWLLLCIGTMMDSVRMVHLAGQLGLLQQVVEAHCPPSDYASRNMRWSQSYAGSM